MIQFLRGKAASFIAKILFGLLILSFAVWGIGDVFRGGGGGNTVAEVAGEPITVIELDQQFRSDVAQLRRLFGPQFTAAQAQQMGQMQRSLATLVSDRLLDTFAARIGYRLTDEAVAGLIRANEVFHDPSTGQFSRAVFLQVLQQNGLTEAGYVALVRRDAARRALIEAAAAGATVPEALIHPVLRFRRETRDVEFVTIPAAAQEAPDPTEADLEAYLEANPDRFLSPEYRILTIVDMPLDDMLASVSVTEEEIAAAYEAEQDAYAQPERRSFDQVIVPDAESAAAVAEAMRAGSTVEAALAELDGVEGSLVPIEATTAADMPLPAMAEAGFALDAGAVADPVQSPFGWHVLALREIIPAHVRPLDEVRQEIEARLKTAAALDQLFDRGNRLENAVADGVPPAEAALEVGFATITTPPVAANGTTADGSPLPEALPEPSILLPLAFSLPEDGESRMTQAGESRYFVVHVDEIVPPAPQPLDAVRDAVAEAWRAERRAEAAAALAETARDRLAAGEPVEVIAEAVGGTPGTAQALLRDGGAQAGLAASLIEPVFALAPGDAVAVETAAGHTVLRLAAIHVPDPAAETEAGTAIADTLRGRIAGDLESQFVEALRSALGVTYYDAAVSRLSYEG